jgi:hypothetical protein
MESSLISQKGSARSKLNTYIKVRWIHADPDDPVWLYSELDSERWEIRKIEIFPDDTWTYAEQNESCGEIDLAECPTPPLSEIAEDPQFDPCEITKEDFEELWSKRKFATLRKLKQ